MRGIKQEALVLLSGGIDSAACAHFLKNRGSKVSAIHIRFGQAAAIPELRSAKKIAAHLSIPLAVCEFDGPNKFTRGEIFGRNSFLISAAVLAMQQRRGLVAMGIHAGTPYFDCSEIFSASMTRQLSEESDGQLTFSAPFIGWSKAQVFSYFESTRIPLQLTFSCEASSAKPCGRCASCKDRSALKC